MNKPPYKISVYITVVITNNARRASRMDNLNPSIELSGSSVLEWEVLTLGGIALKAQGAYLNDDINITINALRTRLCHEVKNMSTGDRHADLWPYQYAAIFIALRLLRNDFKNEKEWYKINKYDYNKSKPIY